MNEQLIDELWQEAVDATWTDNSKAAYEKFAELIVQECLLAISKTKVSEDEIPTMVKCHDQVEDHFGVEE